MADANPFPRTVASITREGRGPQTHAYDAPDIGPLEFLQAVYHATHLPMSVRIQAAEAALPYANSFPRPVVQGPTITIVIGGLKDPEQINEKSQLKEFLRADNCQPWCGDPGPSNTEMNSNPPAPKPFLSTTGPSYIEKTLERLSLSEIIKIVANTPEHLLPVCTICNFPMVYPCSVILGDHRSGDDPCTLPCVTRHTRGTVH